MNATINTGYILYPLLDASGVLLTNAQVFEWVSDELNEGRASGEIDPRSLQQFILYIQDRFGSIEVKQFAADVTVALEVAYIHAVLYKTEHSLEFPIEEFIPQFMQWAHYRGCFEVKSGGVWSQFQEIDCESIGHQIAEAQIAELEQTIERESSNA